MMLNRDLWSRMRPLNCLLLFALIGLGPRIAHAQGADAPPARLRVGPFAVTPTLAIQDLGIDSNVFNTGREQTADFTFAVVPTIRAVAGSRRTNVTVTSVTDFVYFAQQDSERSVNEDFDAIGRVVMRRVTLFGEAEYINTRQRADEEIDARSRRINGAGEAGVSVAIGPKLSVQVSGRYSETEFDANDIFDDTRLSVMLNREVTKVTGMVRYAITPLTTFVFLADTGDTHFHESPIRDSNSRRIQGGVDFAPRALMTGSAIIGHERFRSINHGFPDFEGLIGSLNLSYRLRGSTTFGLGLDRNPSYSYSETEPYYVRQGGRLSVRRQLSTVWHVGVNVERFDHIYRRLGTTLVQTGRGRSDRLKGAGAEVGYRMGPRTRGAVAIEFRERRSEERPSRNYDSFRLGTSVVYGF